LPTYASRPKLLEASQLKTYNVSCLNQNVDVENAACNIKPRATLCVFSHANIETTSSKGVHCSVSDAW